MKSKRLVVELVILLSLLQVNCSFGARILGFLGAASRSHFIVEQPIFKELAARGHDVTVVTSYKEMGKPLPNYRHIEIPDFLDDSALNSFSSDALQSADKSSHISKIFLLINGLTGYSINLMRHPKFLPLKSEHFDLLVIGWFLNEYALGLSAHFHCPSVIISPNVNFYAMRRLSGNPSSVTTVPSLIFGINPDMKFLDRVYNVFAYGIEFLMFETMFQFYTMPHYTKEFPPDKYPPFDEVLKNVSLVLITQHFSTQNSEALLPNVIEVEGMHIKKKPDPLPTDIKEFLDNATDGAIFFSLGSNVKSSEFSQEKVSVLLNKFGSLQQKVLWKFEAELPNLPNNVKIGKWLPQDDILAHPNIKLFISHCGKGGITEAKYHGVPILAIPIFGDQFSNAENILNEGWAISLPLRELDAQTFSNVLDQALFNATYANVAKHLSALTKDRPEHPLDRAAFWIEYVIRHNGAKHIRSPAIHLNLLQFYSIDVLAFILVVVWVTARVVKVLYRVLLSKVFGIKRRKSKKE